MQAGSFTAVAQTKKPSIIVVGAGPIGRRFVELLSDLLPSASIKWFGDEPHAPYDRIKLTPLLSGNISYEDIFYRPLPEQNNVVLHFGSRIVAINSNQRLIADNAGNAYPYDKLILATGSSPHIPDIPGVDAEHVYCFRNLKDVEQLQARKTASRHTVVVGAGLLGLEAARSMLAYSTRVTVVQQAPRIMNRQLDEGSAFLLQSKLEALGINFRLGAGVREILKDSLNPFSPGVNGVRLQGGAVINCDTVVLCSGIKPNIELAQNAKLNVQYGIRVNQKLQTSNPDIYAIGECAQFESEIVGLVGPGLEQAAVAAHHIANRTADYHGYISATHLKIAEEKVFSVGSTQEEFHDDLVKSYTWKSGNAYRKIYLRKRIMIGALAIGAWPESYQLLEYVQQKRPVSFARRLLFQMTGNVFDESDAMDIKTWPPTALVCNCKNVSQLSIVSAYQEGYTTPQQIAWRTGASTVCGACKPLLNAFTGHKDDALPPHAYNKSLTLFGIFTIIGSLIVLLSTPIAYSDSVQSPWRSDLLWIETLYKQVSGFSILALTLLTLLLSLSKRWNNVRPGSFLVWRNIHTIAGSLILLLLFAHTGLHFGINLNQWLMLDFVCLSLLGGATALMSAQQLARKYSLSLRRTINWMHLVAFWPLPVLLSFHIVSVYYF